VGPESGLAAVTSRRQAPEAAAGGSVDLVTEVLDIENVGDQIAV